MKRTISLVLALLSPALLGGCDGRTPQPNLTAPPAVKRPFLRDAVRKEDVVCGEEPSGSDVDDRVDSAGEYIIGLRAWGRECKRKGETGWSLITGEAGQ